MSESAYGGDAMKIGFTGTREGMTKQQADAVEDWLLNEYVGPDKPTEAHQGCCVGADADFCKTYHNAITGHLVGWPSDLEKMTSQRALTYCDEIHQPQPPLVRNRCIVDACDVLLACPATSYEQFRSGTWATIRYARKKGKPVVIFYPDGEVE